MHYSKTYGINRRSALSCLQYFDICEQLPQDVMHVLLEGVVPRSVALVLQHVIVDLRIISIDALNARIASFPYAYFESPNKPSRISMPSILNLELEGTQTGTSLYKKLLFILI